MITYIVGEDCNLIRKSKKNKKYDDEIRGPHYECVIEHCWSKM